jgi:hypothetical protein
MAHRLGNPQWNRHQVDQQRRPQPDRNRHRHLLPDQLHHRLVPKETAPEIEPQILDDHLAEPLMRRPVKPEHPLNIRHHRRIQPPRPPIRPLTRRRRHALRPRPRHPHGGVPTAALDVGNHLLHRPPGCELNHHEIDRDDPKQRRNHQQQPPQYVGDHLAWGAAKQGQGAALDPLGPEAPDPRPFFACGGQGPSRRSEPP